MKCLNCNNKAKGKSKYCSDKCKVAWNRNKRNTESVTSVTEKQSVTIGLNSQNEGRQFKYYKFKPIIGELTKQRQTSQRGFNDG